MIRSIRVFAAAFILTLIGTLITQAQPTLQNDYSYSMEIPSVVGMESSAAHLYVLSDNEGMAVFRTRQDSLQWLYTAAGMQQRGHTLQSDIRFAYLYGDNQRLTVLEPTSVMGAYSATNLPDIPKSVVRIDDYLYIALGPDGFGRLSLKTPDAVDSEIEIIDTDAVSGKEILDLNTSNENLYALTDNRSIAVYSKNEDGIEYKNMISFEEDISRIFYLNNTLLGTTADGVIYEIGGNGNLSELGSIGESINSITAWKDWLIFKGESNRLWSSYQLTRPTLWKGNRDAGNYITTSKGQLWISEYNRISRIMEGEPQNGSQATEVTADEPVTTELEIVPIDDQVIPYPNALLIPLKLKGNYPLNNVQFSLQADPANAKIRGQSLYWKPSSGNNAEYKFKVIASTPDGKNSSTTFTVESRPFNSPPRFTPLRTISIPAGRPFNLPIRANDPDATNSDLVRYIGVNLPDGATIDDQTGEFNWTPTDQQVGENSFRVIATDQYGAASSANVTIRVVETNSSGN